MLFAIADRLPEAVFSGCTAGWLHGLDLPPDDPIEVTVPNAHISNRAGVYIRRTALARVEIVRLRGFPVTSALRTAVDLGSHRVLADAVIALDMALHKRIVNLAALRSFCEARPGAKRIAKLRRAVELAEPATESPMETRLRLILVMARLPRPRAQVHSTIKRVASSAARTSTTPNRSLAWSTTVLPTGTPSSKTTGAKIAC
jgi:hypothetical protein